MRDWVVKIKILRGFLCDRFYTLLYIHVPIRSIVINTIVYIPLSGLQVTISRLTYLIPLVVLPDKYVDILFLLPIRYIIVPHQGSDTTIHLFSYHL